MSLRITDKGRYDFAMHCTMAHWQEWMAVLAETRQQKAMDRLHIVAARVKRWRKGNRRRLLWGADNQPLRSEP